MAEVICPENEMEVIPPEVLLDKVMEKKEQGLWLSQACAAWVDGKYELSYSFANDETYQYQTLRIVMEKDTEVSSITAFYPYAFLYENEMKELFGVKIKSIHPDYQNKLYRIKAETPFLKEEDK